MAAGAAVAAGCCPPNPTCILGTLSVGIVVGNLVTLGIGLVFNASPIIYLALTAIICTIATWLLARFPFAKTVVTMPIPTVGLVLVTAARTGNMRIFIDITGYPIWLGWLLDGITDIIEQVLIAIPEGVAWLTFFAGGGMAVYNILNYLESRKSRTDFRQDVTIGAAPANAVYNAIPRDIPPAFGELPFITCK